MNQGKEARYTVLLVEDHEASVTAMARLLRLHGYDVSETTSALEAVELALQKRYDVLVCDIDLRDGNGCDVFDTVKSMYPAKGMALTGHALPEEVRRCQRAGFSSILLKPVEFGVVLKELDKLCGKEVAA